MKLRSAILMVAAILAVAACGPKTIRKQSVPQEDAIMAVRLVAAGDKLLVEGKEHLAMLKYLEASKLNPYHEVIFNKLAVTYSQLRMYSQATSAINRSIGLNPDYAFAYNTRGIINLAQQSDMKAARSFRKAIDLDPTVGYFYVNLGYVLIQQGRGIEAREIYRKGIEVDPGLFENENMVELSYSTVQELGPEKYFELARVYADLGHLDYCLRYLGKAFSGGLSNSARIMSDPAFEVFMEDEKFLGFLRIHGVI
jgi:tetratricopeptide (TPR) repeat protein